MIVVIEDNKDDCYRSLIISKFYTLKNKISQEINLLCFLDFWDKNKNISTRIDIAYNYGNNDFHSLCGRGIMPRRKNQNQAGTVYLIFVGIVLFVTFIIYLGYVKDPTANIERKTERVDINLEDRV